MLDPKSESKLQLKKEKWKTFVLLDKEKQDFELVLKKGSEILYEVCGEYAVKPYS